MAEDGRSMTETGSYRDVHRGPVARDPGVSSREEEEEEEEDKQVLTGTEDFALRVDGATTLERLMGITALVGGSTHPWYSNSLESFKGATFKNNYSCKTERPSITSAQLTSAITYVLIL